MMAILKHSLMTISLWLAFIFSISAAEAPEEILEAAQNGLITFLNSVPGSELEKIGFKSNQDISQLSIGSGFKLQDLSADGVASLYQSLESSAEGSLNEEILAEALQETNVWYFPILDSNRAVSMLVLDKFEEKWQVVSIGASELGQQLERLHQAMPAAADYHPEIISVNQAFTYLITIPELNQPNLAVLPTDSEADLASVFQSNEGGLKSTAQYLMNEIQKYQRSGYGAEP